MNSLYALVLTDSLHLPTIIGYFNTRPAACQARQSAHAWLKGESQSVESLKCFSNAAMNILDQCRTAIEKNPAHYIDLRIRPVDDLSDPETTPFRVYYETAAGDRYFTVMETVTDLSASRMEISVLPKSGSSMIPAKFPPSSKMIGNPKRFGPTLPPGSAIITKLPPITTKTQSSVLCVPACMILSATTAPSSPPIKKSARRFPPTTSKLR